MAASNKFRISQMLNECIKCIADINEAAAKDPEHRILSRVQNLHSTILNLRADSLAILLPSELGNDSRIDQILPSIENDENENHVRDLSKSSGENRGDLKQQYTAEDAQNEAAEATEVKPIAEKKQRKKFNKLAGLLGLGEPVLPSPSPPPVPDEIYLGKRKFVDPVSGEEADLRGVSPGKKSRKSGSLFKPDTRVMILQYQEIKAKSFTAHGQPKRLHLTYRDLCPVDIESPSPILAKLINEKHLGTIDDPKDLIVYDPTNTAKRKHRAPSLMVYLDGVIGTDMCKASYYHKDVKDLSKTELWIGMEVFVEWVKSGSINEKLFDDEAWKVQAVQSFAKALGGSNYVQAVIDHFDPEESDEAEYLLDSDYHEEDEEDEE